MQMMNLAEASVVRPYSLSEYPGYEELIQGIEAFDKRDFNLAEDLFLSSLDQAYPIRYNGNVFIDEYGTTLGYPWLEVEDYWWSLDGEEHEFNPGDYKPKGIGASVEVRYAVSRYCNFYLGLISLN